MAEGGAAGSVKPGTSEDCLYLTVYTPPAAVLGGGLSALPVMIWIYGGGFQVRARPLS